MKHIQKREMPKDSFEALKIVVLDDQDDRVVTPHRHMIGFGNSLSESIYTPNQFLAYRDAMEDVLREKHRDSFFYQVGFGSKDGRHLWEISDPQIDRAALEKLIPDIHARAHELFERHLKNVGLK